MIYLVLSILSSSVIFITFKITEQFKANLIKLISINYLAAFILGFSFNRYPISLEHILTSEWLPFALLVGLSFILMFFMIGYSIRISGVAVTTIAGKMSMVIPILFSILYFSEKTPSVKVAGLILATVSVFLTVYRPTDKKINLWPVILPLVIFLGSGITDSIVKYAQTFFVPNELSLLFSTVVFLTALVLGLTFILFRLKTISKSITTAEVIGGTILGVANFGSLYFFVMALNNSKFDSSILFGLNNICIVLFSVLIGALVFKEKLSKLNFAGVIMAFAAILILMNY
ncbi:MAG: DMT family transporter [Prolixibacteraceae bacterium]|nr:DMT family transporter [Prolixibacteraceae bacterium]